MRMCIFKHLGIYFFFFEFVWVDSFVHWSLFKSHSYQEGQSFVLLLSILLPPFLLFELGLW